jgi:hypothetical protein
MIERVDAPGHFEQALAAAKIDDDAAEVEQEYGRRVAGQKGMLLKRMHPPLSPAKRKGGAGAPPILLISRCSDQLGVQLR